MKTVKFFTLGCKVNQYETQVIREGFIRLGFKELDDSQPADIYVINTCTVTQKADSDSLGLVRRAKRENPIANVIVTGCLAELDTDKIKNTCASCLIVKNKDKADIFKVSSFDLLTHKPTNPRTLNGISYFKGHTRAFLKIQDGCNNSCSYCKVSLVRGQSLSKPIDEVIQEAKDLVKNGFKEIVLCGICLGAYGKDLSPRFNLIDVIQGLEKIEGLFRIRLSSIEAIDVSSSLIDIMSKSAKLCRHLHIPIQSGDDEILKRMNRRYTRSDYLALVRKIRQRVPGISITTDCLVGFPGENERNFNNTLKLIREILPLKVHVFPYSDRKGTAAFDFKDKVQQAKIKSRSAILKNLAQECSYGFLNKFLNKNLEVLFEANFNNDPHLWQGFSSNYIKVILTSKQNLKNAVIYLKINKISKVTSSYIFIDK